jgi:hypothetical protein
MSKKTLCVSITKLSLLMLFWRNSHCLLEKLHKAYEHTLHEKFRDSNVDGRYNYHSV